MKRAAQIAGLLVLLIAAAGRSAPVPPHASWSQASLSNGFAAAVVDTLTGKPGALYPHPYQEGSPDALTPDLLYDAFFGFSHGPSGSWLPTVPPTTVDWENGTGILVVVRENWGLRFTERFFVPMSVDAPVLVATITVRNLLAGPIPQVHVFSLHNLHVGAGTPIATEKGETIAWDAAHGGFLEQGATSGRRALAVPLDAPLHHVASPADPYGALPGAGTLATDADSDGATRDDAISAFEWDAGALTGGEERTFGFALAVADGPNPTTQALWEALAPLTAAGSSLAVLGAEREWWKAFHAKDVLPGAVSAGEPLALARQALATLAMAQVREPDADGRTPHGQILASLPPGIWNRTWVRDQSYATVALARTGHADAAADALRFIAHGKAGTYAQQVGVPYGVSVCRYYGDGAEESDSNAFGPNVELDGFGLFLWSFREVASQPGQQGLVAELWPWAKTAAADVLVATRDESGLVGADSSIWEHHWNNQQRHFTYTDVAAVRGLCAASELAALAGGDGTSWRDAARGIAFSIRQHLATPAGLLAGNLEEIAGGHALDAAVVEAFNWGVVDPQDPIAATTLAALSSGLSVPSGHGWRRNDDGDWYDRQEWVFIDLRAAAAYARVGPAQVGQDLAGWVMDQAHGNLRQFAELYAEDSADYAGAVPMIGFGAGAFLLWATEAGTELPLAACLHDAPQSEPQGEPDGGEEAALEPGPEVAGEWFDTAPETAAEIPGEELPDASLTDVAAADETGTGPDPAVTSGGGCASHGATNGPGGLMVLMTFVWFQCGAGLQPRRSWWRG